VKKPAKKKAKAVKKAKAAKPKATKLKAPKTKAKSKPKKVAPKIANRAAKKAKPLKSKSKIKTPARKLAAKPGKKAKPAPKKKITAKAPAPRKLARKPAPPPQAAIPKWPPLVETLLTKLDEAKAEAIVTIDLTGKSTMADTMVVASGRSNRHVDAIARQAIEELEKSGVKNIRSEGMPQCDWVLVDAGDILLHVFRPEVRSFYNLEKLWSAHAP
jgi:ribosome-associated protein